MNVINVPTNLFIIRGVPARIRCNDGPDFIKESSQEMDQDHRQRDRLYQTWSVLGKRLLREIERLLQGRTLNSRNIPYTKKRSNHNQTMAEAVQ